MKKIIKTENITLTTILLLCICLFTLNRFIKVNPTETSIQEDRLKISALPLENYSMTPGTPYNWIDASGGTELVLADDGYATILLPFTFTFYNQTFSTVYLSANGYLSFTDTTPDYFDNIPFPTDYPYFTYMVAPFWDDIYPPDGGHIYVQSFGTYWVAEWLDIYHIDGPILGSFEVVLYETGQIQFNYDYIDYIEPYSGYTCGLNLGENIDYYNTYLGLDNSTDDFSILFNPESINVITPDKSSVWEVFTVEQIIWSSTSNVSNVKIELYKKGVFEREIAANIASIGVYSWNISSGLNDSDQYQIKISDASNPLTYDYSPNFEIFNPTFTIITPNSSSLWVTDKPQEINWTSRGTIPKVKIELYKEDIFEMEIARGLTNNGKLIWVVPKGLQTSEKYQVKIIDDSNPSVFSFSDYFKIKKATSAIPGYSVFVLIGLVGIISVILFKKRLKLIK
ncbi:MAG: Ser-Thr-rich GPI-anchored membrane family protein [Promethearchaeota archaeon]